MSRRLHQLSTTFAIVLGGLSLSACAHTQFAGFSNAHMAQAGIFQHPDFNHGVVPTEAHKQIARLSDSCQQQGRGQVAGLGQSATTGAVAGAVVDSVTLSQDAKILHYAEAARKLVTKEGLVNGALNGGYSNTVTGAVSAAGTIGSCTRDFWNINKTYHPDPGRPDFTAAKYKGTAVEAITAGKGFGGGPETDHN